MSFVASTALGQSPSNDSLADAAPLFGDTLAWSGSNIGATREPDEPRHAGYGGQNSVWCSWIAPAAGVAVVDLTASFRGAVAAVYTGKYTAGLSLVTSNAFANPDGTARLRFDAQSGTTYQLAIDGDIPGRTGPVHLSLQLLPRDQPPEILLQPLDQSVIEAVANPLFEVTTRSATPVSYQWRWNGTPLPNATNRTLALPGVGIDQAGAYQVVVANGGGSVTSRVAQLTVRPRPANDDFARSLTLQGVDATATGSNVDATREPTEPFGAYSFYSTLWWTWTAPATGTADLNLAGSYPDAGIDVFTGDAPAALSLVPADFQLNADLTARMQFRTIAGAVYRLRVGSPTRAAARQGAVSLRLRQLPPDLLPEIIVGPADLDVIEREGSPRFAVQAWSPTPLRYQWRFNESPIPDATNLSLALPRVRLDQAGRYDVMVANLAGSTITSPALLVVHARPSNDDFVERTALMGTEARAEGDARFATTEPGEDRLGSPTRFKSIWWTWTAPADGAVAMDLAGSFKDARLDVFTGPTLSTLQPADTIGATNLDQTSIVRVRTVHDTAYALRVAVPAGSNSGQVGIVRLQIRPTPTHLPPELVLQPQDRQALERQDSPVFEVRAWSASPLTFQWRFNGSPLPDATRPVLVLTNVALSAQGDYDVEVANAGGIVLSRRARLTVLPRPPNDDFTNRFAATTSTLLTGSTLNATRETGEPTIGTTYPRTLWWTWTASAAGPAQIDLAGNPPDTAAEVFTGGSLTNLTPVPTRVRPNPDRTARYQFDALPGIPYALRIGSLVSAGSVQFRLGLLSPPRIVSEPDDLEVGTGEDARFTVTADGDGPFRYLWRAAGLDLPNATNASLSLPSVAAADAGSYSVVIANDAGAVTSRIAVLRLGRVLFGTVTDAIDNHPLAGVGVVVDGRTNFTDATGRYRFAGLPAAEGFRVDFAAGPRFGEAPLPVSFTNLTTLDGLRLLAFTNGYAPYLDEAVRTVTNGVVTNHFALSPVLPAGSLRLVLHWQATPRDLDAHLLTPAIDGTPYHIDYHRAHDGRPDVAPFARLDFDHTNGFGPETLTIARFVPGTYRYFVQNFAGQGDLAGSGAITRVYRAEGEPLNITVPETGLGRYWHVCDIDGATRTIHVVNRLVESPPTPASSALATPSVRSPPSPDPTPLSPSRVRYLWDFGDGTRSTEESPTATYAHPGRYTVSLAVVAPDGATQTLLRTNYIVAVAPNEAPTISAPTTVRAPAADPGTIVEILVDDFDSAPSQLEVTAVSSDPALLPPTGLNLGGTGTRRTLRIRPADGRAGTVDVLLEVSDGRLAAATRIRVEVPAVEPPSTTEPRDIMVVLASPDPTLETLAGYLEEWRFAGSNSRTWRTLPRTGLDAGTLLRHRLVIWNDPDGSQPLTDGELALLQGAHDHGVALYFIGPRLPRAADSLSVAARTQWWNLLHLLPVSSPSGTEPVEPDTDTAALPLVHGAFGTLDSFPLDTPSDAASATPDAVVFARRRFVDVVVGATADLPATPGSTRTLTQTLPLVIGGPAESVAPRRLMFQNGLCWLLSCNACSQVYLALANDSPASVITGSPFHWSLSLGNHGECAAEGFRATVLLAKPLRTLATETIAGEVFAADDRVELSSQALGPGAVLNLDLTLLPLESGSLTNRVRLEAWSRPAQEYDVIIDSAGDRPPVLAAATQLGQLRLRVVAEPGRRYNLERAAAASADPELRWLPVATFEFTPPFFEWLEPVAATSTAIFYRAVARP